MVDWYVRGKKLAAGRTPVPGKSWGGEADQRSIWHADQCASLETWWPCSKVDYYSAHQAIFNSQPTF